MMGELGVRPDVIDRCLNHVEPNRMIRTYQRQELMRERQEAFPLLGTHLDALVDMDGARIVAMAEARPMEAIAVRIERPAAVVDATKPMRGFEPMQRIVWSAQE